MPDVDAETTTGAPAPKPLLPCDIVMAGGVTSGIIYPGAVAEISKRYGFHAIGGTSVGAIAAAVTAAAEFGRRTGGNPHAFQVVSGLPTSLGERAPDGRSRMFHLFAAESGTRGLMGLLTALFGARGGWAKFRAVAGSAIRAPVIGLSTLLAFMLGSWIVFELARDGHLVAGTLALLAVAALVVTTFAVVVFLMLRNRWLPAWRDNGYGVCTGLASPEAGRTGWDGFKGLTCWLHESVQTAAGRGPDAAPLTFGDLWGAPALDGTSMEGEVTAFTPRSIELAMIASDISRNRTVQLPFLETPSPLYVERRALERYFPGAIMVWMAGHAGVAHDKIDVPEGCFRLPPPQDIPVAFAARLSLSFPVLLCAVPLWTPDFGAKRTPDGRFPLRRVWFSDGGLTSNFPIHFFDRPMPSHPTFCLNLVDFDTRVAREPDAVGDGSAGANADEAAGQTDKPIAEPRAEARRSERRPDAAVAREPHPGAEVWGFVTMADGNRVSPVPFTAFDAVPGTGLGPFLKTLVNTARFWSDNQLLLAPGFRDRIVHIALREDEGGLNLDMDPRVIADLDRRGRAAGAKIAAQFDPDARVDPETGGTIRPSFPRHRWVRYRAFMAAVEDLSRRYAVSLRKSGQATAERREASLADMISGTATGSFGYEPLDVARGYYQRATALFDRFALDLAAETARDPHHTFDEPRMPGMSPPRRGPAPRPKMGLKLRPLVDADPRTETSELPS